MEDSDAIPSFKVEDRLSLELVIAFVGPVGSGVSTSVAEMKRQIEQVFGYTAEYIKISSIIAEFASEVGPSLQPELSGSERIDQFQNAGNALRDAYGPAYLADRVIERIALTRRASDGFLKRSGGADVPIPRKVAYFVDSLKSPAELMRLREVYGDLFWAVTVFAPHEVRERRLRNAGSDELTVRNVMKRDEDEGSISGQHVSSTAHLADYFIRNHTDNVSSLIYPIERFLQVIFRTHLHTPTANETGMMKAASAAIRSACLSRQVGASIYSFRGELLGSGCNDVLKFGGGLYGGDQPSDVDNRCYRWGGNICHNGNRKRRLAEAISRGIVAAFVEKVDFRTTFESVVASEARNLIEFSRSVHAEMEAIVSVARAGTGSTVGATLYSTTFPCHSCARHIVAAGISRVVFIEPYSKSLALDLHHDSITLSDEVGKVQFVQYEGFSPRSALRVYSTAGFDRKTGGHFISVSPREARPIYQCPLDSYISTEGLIVQQLTGK